MLEKHSDYQARSRSYHRKQDTIKHLNKIADKRNPDEFYHGMIKEGRLKQGLLVQRLSSLEDVKRVGDDAPACIDSDVVRLMKTQDLTHLRMLRQVNLAKLNKQQQITEHNQSGKHCRFVESVEEGLELLPQVSAQTEDKIVKAVEQDKVSKVRKERVGRLDTAIKALELQRALLGPGKKQKVRMGEDGIAIYKWASQRRK